MPLGAGIPQLHMSAMCAGGSGSGRFRRFNLSLGKADVSGSWRTWEVATANSPGEALRRSGGDREEAEPGDTWRMGGVA